jgi:hypothetical protein
MVLVGLNSNKFGYEIDFSPKPCLLSVRVVFTDVLST